jgi:hypothetical protein
MVRVTATASPQLQRSKSRTFVLERAKKARKFKQGYARDLVRDEGVAGSNPATPTRFFDHTTTTCHFGHIALEVEGDSYGDRLTARR